MPDLKEAPPNVWPQLPAPPIVEETTEPQWSPSPWVYAWSKRFFDAMTIAAVAIMSIKIVVDLALWAWRSVR